MDNTLKKLLIVAFFLHLGAALFIYFAKVYPFGGGEGDQLFYHRAAFEISENFRQGDFSIAHIKEELKKESMDQAYPVVVGTLYALTFQNKLVGQLLSIAFFLASLAVFYFIMKEMGVSETWRFRMGVVASIYPSYIYFGSMLLKESLIAFLFLLVIFLSLKLLKEFSWKLFAPLFLALLLLFHFRLYVGAAAVGGVVLALRRNILIGVLILAFIGFVPMILGKGYFGTSEIRSFFEPERLADYGQRVGDAPSPHTGLVSPQDFLKNPLSAIQQLFPQSEKNITPSGDREAASTIRGDSKGGVLALLKTLPQSFASVLLGPFPWDMKYLQQFLALAETIPWYVLLFFAIKGSIVSQPNRKNALIILVASFALLLIIAVFTNNYGTYIRIRIPAFLALLSLVPFAFSQKHG